MVSNPLKGQSVKSPVPLSVMEDAIINAVALVFGVSIEALKGSGRTRRVSMARHAAMYLLRELLSELTLKDVGGLLGGKDHTTVIHGVRHIEEEIRLKTSFAKIVQGIENQIQAQFALENK